MFADPEVQKKIDEINRRKVALLVSAKNANKTNIKVDKELLKSLQKVGEGQRQIKLQQEIASIEAQAQTEIAQATKSVNAGRNELKEAVKDHAKKFLKEIFD